MKVGVPKETAAKERRVALTPDVAGKLVKSGLTVLVERGAGEAASFGDEAYRAAGATIGATAAEVFAQGDVILKVQPPSAEEVRLCPEGAAVVAVFQPSAEREIVSQLAGRKVTAFSLALLPRITRAQPMDVLSSQATVAGYKAVLLAATATGRFFPMLVTAAGTLPPARVLVLGAGVAGLQAIATARRLGAVVSAFDVRPAVKEQVESLGAKFVGMQIGEQAETARLRHGAVRGHPPPRADVYRAASEGRRHRHHDGGDPGEAGAGADHGRGGAGDEAGLGDRGPRGGDGREL